MDTKQCSMCKEIKLRSDFGVNKGKKTGLQSRCKTCTNKHRNSVYYLHRDKEIERSFNRRKMLVAWLKEYKSTLSCERCDYSHPSALDFHHSNGDKEFGIATATNRGFSIDRIKKEIDKCAVLCANCHRLEHWKSK